MTLTVRHFGNTANNADYLSRILENLPSVQNAPFIKEFGLKHAISSPAWEHVDFEVRQADWVQNPDWNHVHNAESFTSRVQQHRAGRRITHHPILRWGSSLLRKSRVLRGIVILAELLIAKEAILEENQVSVFYGQNFINALKIPSRSGKTILLEHGTIRWCASASTTLVERVQKARYVKSVRAANFLLVTNLDPETLHYANQLAPGRWCAFPHPYIPSGLAPFESDQRKKEKLLRETNSEILVLLASSHNWSATHDKGTGRALQALSTLRKSGYQIGLVTLNWGLDVQRSRDFLEREGLSDCVAWLPAQPRIQLQKLAASCDISWNQFGYDAIGAFDLRMLEQGTPHVSRGLSEEGVQLVGAQVPWSIASTPDEIFSATKTVVSNLNTPGYRDSVRSEYDSWYRRFHSPDLTRRLFIRVLGATATETGGLTLPADSWREEALEGK